MLLIRGQWKANEPARPKWNEKKEKKREREKRNEVKKQRIDGIVINHCRVLYTSACVNRPAATCRSLIQLLIKPRFNASATTIPVQSSKNPAAGPDPHFSCSRFPENLSLVVENFDRFSEEACTCKETKRMSDHWKLLIFEGIFLGDFKARNCSLFRIFS